MVAVSVTIGATSCGNETEGDSTGTTAVQLTATNYVTIPPSASTEAPPSTTGGPQPEQEYIIEAVDIPVTIARQCNVPFEDLMTLNEWVLEGQFVTNFPPVGTPIRIPAGGTLPGETLAPQTTTASSATAPVFTAAPTTTLSPECQPGEYTIESGDFPIRVAEKFDVTLGALNSINGNTPGYSSFAPGTVIKIPASSAGC